MVREHHTSECVDEDETENKIQVRIHGSLSDSMIQNVITRSAHEMRTIGDCCARRQSLGKLAKDVESSLQKARNRRSDSLLQYLHRIPAEFHKLCWHCNTTADNSTDQGLHFRMQKDSNKHETAGNSKDDRDSDEHEAGGNVKTTR